MTRQEIAGEHLVPAAPSRLWEALTDPDTVARALPPRTAVEWVDGQPRELRVADGRAITLQPVEVTPASALRLRLGSGASGSAAPFPSLAGEFVAMLRHDEAFTRVTWRLDGAGDVEDAPLRAAVDDFLARIGQHAAVPVTVAAGGLAGVATAATATAVAATPATSGPSSALAPLFARMRAWPRDLAIGGALFAVVLLIVVGIL